MAFPVSYLISKFLYAIPESGVSYNLLINFLYKNCTVVDTETVQHGIYYTVSSFHSPITHYATNILVGEAKTDNCVGEVKI